jgi:hypothetical protein
VTLDAFLEHHGLTENPFAGEEARQDSVFRRMSDPGAPVRPARHADFQKIIGDLAHPSTSVVFGEKGSGKTSLRIQLASAAERYNQAHPGARVLIVGYDDLNPFIERLHARLRTVSRGKESSVLDSIKKIRLQDHIDAICHLVVPNLVDALLGQSPRGEPLPVGPEPMEALKDLDRSLKRDLLALQVCYDRGDAASDRSAELRRAMGVRRPWGIVIETILALSGWLLPAGVLAAWYFKGKGEITQVWSIAFFVAMGVWVAFLLKRAVSDRIGLRHRAHRLYRQVRITGRPEPSYVSSMRQLPPWWRTSSTLPTTESESVRFAMLDRLMRVLRHFGHAGVVVVVDRVDEPALIAGDVEKMRAFVWPLLNNKLLQMQGLGVKMLLPMELRHMLFRESAAFFTAARLDKQNLIEDLGWTGSTLYDLCALRMGACRRAGLEPSAGAQVLPDLFAHDVSRQDLIDALEAMRTPRDAFKMVYACIAEHCRQVTQDSGGWRIPKSVLDSVRKAQLERVRQLAMGVRPG